VPPRKNPGESALQQEEKPVTDRLGALFCQEFPFRLRVPVSTRLTAFDFAGNKVWEKPLGPFPNRWRSLDLGSPEGLRGNDDSGNSRLGGRACSDDGLEKPFIHKDDIAFL
jgi:hypothetical protein